ncbi:uncharacterized protein LOC123536326 [Mercenaria mercenaria]|uniref:uncharacterized protein LOC123536326 n=1 Tax=Mercenaria mercenaria TaxID=6596 RepID=UPI00234EB35A|nr:uncharacterized protein LOC123536326 [Mercenaria mercenaria]
MRQMGIGYWIDYFKNLDDNGVLSTESPVHVECLRFCFTKLLQKELDELREQWNLHRVRTSSSFAGKPNLLYHHPELFGARDYKFPVEFEDIDALERFTVRTPQYGCLDAYVEEFQILLERNGKEMPETCHEAITLYLWLIQQI